MTPDFEAKAREIAAEFRALLPDGEVDTLTHDIGHALREAYTAGVASVLDGSALREARASALEEAAKVADEEVEAMLAQRDDLIERGEMGGRKVPENLRKVFAVERRVLADGYFGLANSIRALKETQP
jgi:hypothetical protein